MGSSKEFYRVLDECIEAIEFERKTIETCLIQNPKHRAELQQLLPLVSALHHAPRIEPPADFRDGARQRLLARLPDTHGHAATRPSRGGRRQRARPLAWRRFGLAWVTAIVVIVALLTGGGMTYAADGAAPGDALYKLDRSIEEVRLALTNDPQAAFELRLALASERLEEAKKVLGEEKTDQFYEAMDYYDGAVTGIAEALQSSAVADRAVLGGLLDKAIVKYDAQLAAMVDGEGGGDTGQIHDRDRDHWCLEGPEGEDPHPVAERLAREYGVSYEEIIGWFCDGFGLGEIGLAYRIQTESGTPVAELFDTRADAKMGWGLILQDEGLIGRPEGAGPPEGVPQGPPDEKGPPADVPKGREDDAGEPEDAGRPEEVPQGKPKDNGPPEGGPPGLDRGSEEQGPPDAVPQGRPEEKGPPPGQAKDKP
jgi:hypothetical protein